MSGTLGFSQQKQKQTQDSSNRPYFINTGYSTVRGQDLSLDPSIRTLQEEALGRSRGLMGNLSQGFNDYTSRSMDIRNRLSSNESPFIQARVNPVMQAGASRLGALQSDIGLRQIGGSSFADQSLSNLSFDTARQIGDASAIANAERLSAITGLDKDMLNALIGRIQVEQNLNGFSNEVAQQRLQQELVSLGLGTESQSTIYGKSQNVFGKVQAGGKDPAGEFSWLPSP